MATIILGAVGRAFAGPVGGLVGSLAGGFVDRALFGGGRRDVGRMDSPIVQSAAYGEPRPVIVGRMRAAGNLIWSSPIAEQVSRSGGGKSGPATNQYSYSASFAVGLAARPILGVGRIWADGRLVRDAAGDFLLQMTMRLHLGGEDQAVDPLIAAAEGVGQTPAYLGLAYAVFEDLPLADFGNRIPNFTFEIVADQGPVDLGHAVRGLVESAGLRLTGVSLGTEGQFPPVSGYYFGQPGSVAEALAPILEVCDASLEVLAGGLRLAGGAADTAGPVTVLADDESHARHEAQGAVRDRQSYSGDGGPDVIELGHYDETREYQAGLQRARRGAGQRLRQQLLPAAMQPAQAKGLATMLLARDHAGRLKRRLSLPWRRLGVRPGMRVRIGSGADVWRVREARFEGFLLTLSVERMTAVVPGERPGDGGRLPWRDEQAAGPTQLEFMELPGLGTSLPASPVLLVAGAGASPGWRRGGFEISQDLGASYAAGGALEAATVMGTVAAPLAPGPCGQWDRHSHIEVALLGSHMWLEGRSEAAVLQGANLALVGDELVQFRDVEVTSAGHVRLRTLLRGRRGTEHAVGGHIADERFVLLDGSGPVAVPSSPEMVGRTLLARAVGAFDMGAAPVPLVVRGEALKPLAPAHVRLSQEGGDILVRWIRRSRAGFAWLDFVDVPLGEETERYRVRLFLDGRLARSVEVPVPDYRYLAAARAEDGGGEVLEIEVVQMSAVVGPGQPAWARHVLS